MKTIQGYSVLYKNGDIENFNTDKALIKEYLIIKGFFNYGPKKSPMSGCTWGLNQNGAEIVLVTITYPS